MNTENTEVISVGEIGATATSGGLLKTYALGSCIGVVVLDPARCAIGMVHIALPSSSTNADRAKSQPGYFADTGIKALLEKMAELGCDRSGRGMAVKIAGGARIIDMSDSFDIGKKNILAVRKCLWQHGLTTIAEDVGDSISRTMQVDVDSGRVVLSTPSREKWEL
jgi:chemotaxis protein CheD